MDPQNLQFFCKMSLSVIVPTYNEVENIRPLVERLTNSFPTPKNLEILIMDDESPGSFETAKIVKQLQDDKYPVRIHQRSKKEGRGLSSAVLLGFQLAKHPFLLCMDADLQHEPEAVPAVSAPVLNGEAEFTVGSRYCHSEGFGFEWAIHRRLISLVATFLAVGVSRSSDPMSGFFCTTKSVLARALQNGVNPIGFKIGLEIMARANAHPVRDVPIVFRERLAGESKLTFKQNILYLQQLAGLYWALYKAVLVLLALCAVMTTSWLTGAGRSIH